MNDFRRFLVKVGAASFAIGAGMETFMCFTGACVHSSHCRSGDATSRAFRPRQDFTT